MDVNLVVGVLVVFFDQLVEGLDIVVATGVGDHNDPDRVLVDVVQHVVKVQGLVLPVHWHRSHFDVPVSAELLPTNLVTRRNN